MNENDAYLFDVEAPTHWTLPGEPFTVSGWFLSKTGALFRDLRLRLDDRIISGRYGLPRPEIEQRHRGHTGYPHAGFSFLVEPHRGATLLRLEILDHGGNWVELWRTPVVAPAGRHAARPVIDPLQLPDLVTALLKAFRAEPAGDHAPLARRLVTEAATETANLEPSLPFRGGLDRPSRIGTSQFGKLSVIGWLIHGERRITRAWASSDPTTANSLRYGGGREDVARHFPGHPQAANCELFGLVDLREDQPDPAFLAIFAELDDGTSHLVFHQRFRQASCLRQELPLPAYSRRTLLRALGELRRAARQLGVRPGPWYTLFPQLKLAASRFHRDAPRHLAAADPVATDPYSVWLGHHRPSPALQRRLTAAAAALAPAGPLLALVADLRDTSPAELGALVSTLQAQYYPRWELRLALPPAAPAPLLAAARQAAAAEPRVRLQESLPEGPIATFTRAVLASAAPHFALLPGHARLAPEALLVVAEALHAAPSLALIYTDEDRMEDDGRRHSPTLRASWSPALALSGLLPGGLAFFSRASFERLGGFRPGFEQTPVYDLLLRLTDDLAPSAVRHLSQVVFHARASRPVEVEPSAPVIEQSRQALAEALSRRHWPAAAFRPETAHHRRRCFFQPRWSAEVLARLPVTIVIPTRDRLNLLEECIERLGATVDWRHVHLIIVDDSSRDRDAVHYLETIQQRRDLRCRVVRPADPLAPFNYSALVNLALPLVETPLILHLNNDVNALEPGWLEDMVGWMTLPEVGVVGAKLLYPDRSLNHCGILIGPHGGLADTPFVHQQESEVREPEWFAVARDVSAVTGACLLTRTDLYRRLGGFEEKAFGVAYNDVDYCLRAGVAGYRTVYSPQAKLMHWGSATRGVTFDEQEHLAFLQRHRRPDPYLSPALEFAAGALAPSPTHYAHAARAGRLRVLLITHNLNLEGAPLFLLEYATHLVRVAGFSVQVLSCEDGPLHHNYRELGATVTFVDRHRLFAAATPAEFASRLGEVAATLDFSGIDLVVSNTLVGYWGVHLARLAGRPSLLYIHESTSVFRFFEHALALPMHRLVEEALATATRTVFLCEATRRYYADVLGAANDRILPGWIEVEAIRRFRREHDRAALRRKHGFAPDDVVIANIGTVCERKGQHTFIRAVDTFRRLPSDGRRHRFVLVGGRAGVYLDLLVSDIARLGLGELIEIVPETREVYEFFVLADLFVCSSFEESFPRVVLEAMAFGTPIVSTDVHGIPEMVKNRAEAWLVAPGDPTAMAQAMRTCLDKEHSGKSFAPTALSKVVRYYDAAVLLPRHVELAREAVLCAEA
jgi:glycosyltransferase involved in cell wall biosynthesis